MVLDHLIKATDWHIVVNPNLVHHLPKALQALAYVLLDLSTIQFFNNACQMFTLLWKHLYVFFKIN